MPGSENMEKNNTKNQLFMLSLIAFLCVILANTSAIFNFLYERVYYGQIVDLFNDVIQIIIYTIAIIFIAKASRKRGFTSLKNKDLPKGYELPIKNMIGLSIITIGAIALISALIGWNVKPIYDLGTYFTGLEMYLKLASILRDAIMLILVYQSLRLADEAFSSLPKAIPLAGIYVTLTFGLYQFLFGIHYLWYIYLFMGIVFHYIYKLSSKSLSRCYPLMLLIYIF